MGEPPKVDNLLQLSWSDSAWVPHLNTANVMDYFSERTNPFYSRDCNNEFLKMQQNARIDALQHMQGQEYMLLHAQDPILYIIRKQQRYSPSQVAPLAAYHIIAGQVFQTPDVGSVINSRLASATAHLNASFTELSSLSSYHPSKGYSWRFPARPGDMETKEAKADQSSGRAAPSTAFQQKRVDALLAELTARFPYRPPAPEGAEFPPTTTPAPPSEDAAAGAQVKLEDVKSEDRAEVKSEVKAEVKTEVKSERVSKPPPEKRARYC